MKQLLAVVIFLIAVPAFAQTEKTPTLRSILLSELHSTHDKSEWFVCVDVAVAGETPEQAAWTDGKGNHSVGQLTYHLLFWNRQSLASLKGETPEKFSGNNDDTFTKFDSKNWSATVKQLDEVMTELEKWVETADEAKLKQEAQRITHISTHNAYHIGEMVMVRKEQGSWDASKGVK
ncbi:MAG: DinB family protein [Candidatus Acidiferrum sp.]